MLKIISKIGSSSTQFTCPKCGHKGAFYGLHVPVTCNKCNVILPELMDMKHNDSERKYFHLSKGCNPRCF